MAKAVVAYTKPRASTIKCGCPLLELLPVLPVALPLPGEVVAVLDVLLEVRKVHRDKVAVRADMILVGDLIDFFSFEEFLQISPKSSPKISPRIFHSQNDQKLASKLFFHLRKTQCFGVNLLLNQVAPSTTETIFQYSGRFLESFCEHFGGSPPQSVPENLA